jgi:predicted RNase H-like HicB family nuclease
LAINLFLNEGNMNTIKVQIDWAGKNYSAIISDINGVIITTHKNYEKLIHDIHEAFNFHIEGSLKDGDKIPKWVIEGDFTFVFEFTTAALLHKYDGILTRSALSKVTGINQRQLGHYASGHRSPRPETRKKIIDGIHQIGKEFMSIV